MTTVDYPKDRLLVPVSPLDLDLLQWFGEWAPGVHKAAWKRRRQWPPGFREYIDASVTEWVDSDERQKGRAEMSLLPQRGKGKRPGSIYSPYGRSMLRVSHLLAYGLVEGYDHGHVCRITQRGRAALLLTGRPCPERFESHCPDIFDDHLLLPVLESWMSDLPSRGGEDRPRLGDSLPDEEPIWRLMLTEYREDDYRGRGTLTGAVAELHMGMNAETPLNGSLRMHRRFIMLTLRNGAGQHVAETRFSLEQFAELLTGDSQVPTTLGPYTGKDGMLRNEPAPMPVSPAARMKARMMGSYAALDDRIAALHGMLETARMAKGLKGEMQQKLDTLQSHLRANPAFALEQATDEMATFLDSGLSILRERADLAGVSFLPEHRERAIRLLGGDGEGNEDDPG